ncbi:MAG TPA: reverse transcriptase-like protein, partial [Solirubrobacterales bacterium]|nr:reverse transcriptase-like protein [Solirubrobacterales bacterium]
MKLIVNVDGGARGNPGPAAIGIVVRDGEGNVLQDLGETIGEATNNVAEYRALIRGIGLARELGATELQIHGDSELVVKQMLGQ